MRMETAEPVSEVTDHDLIVAFADRHDESAFREVMRRYGPMVHGVCLRTLCGDRALADDAVQVVFMVLFRKIETFSAGDSLGGWLYRTACNVALDMVRKEGRRKRREDRSFEMSELERNDGLDGRQEEIRDAIDQAVNALPERLRETVVARFFVGEGIEDIARRSRTTRQTVHKRLRNAMDAVRRRLEKEGHTVSVASLGALFEMEKTVDQQSGLFCSGRGMEWLNGNERTRSAADALIAELDRTATRAMWWKVGGVAAGLATIGVGTAVVVSHFQTQPTAETQPIPGVSWRIESAFGNPSVRRGETMQKLKAGDLMYIGDTLSTESNQEVAVVSEAGGRILLREEGEFKLETGPPRADPPPAENRKLGTGENDGNLPSSTFHLLRGAVVAQLKRSERFTTLHADVETTGADFFLMVANGVTTNATPWSFTRLDVTEGSAKFLPSSISDLKSEIPLVARQVVCAGTDHEGKTIETVTRKSDCRELSPKYVGVFFRDCMRLYETGMCVLDRLQPKEGATVHFTPDDLLRRLRKSVGVDVKVDVITEDGNDVSVLNIVSRLRDKYGHAVFDLPVPARSALAVEFRFQTTETEGTRFRSSSFCNAVGVVQMKECPSVSRHFSRLVPFRNAKWGQYRIERVVVGVLPSGELIHEECSGRDRQTPVVGWIKGGCEEWWVINMNRSFMVTDLTINELMEVSNQN